MTNAILFNIYITATVVLLLVYTVYTIHLIIDDASIIDLVWGAGFGLVAIGLLIFANPKSNYNVLLAVLPIVWSVRYTTFIFCETGARAKTIAIPHYENGLGKRRRHGGCFHFMVSMDFRPERCSQYVLH